MQIWATDICPQSHIHKKKNNTHTKPNDSVEKTAGPMRKETQITEYVEIIKIKS